MSNHCVLLVGRCQSHYTPRRGLTLAVLSVLSVAYLYLTQWHEFGFEPIPRAVLTPMKSVWSPNFYTPALTAAKLSSIAATRTPASAWSKPPLQWSLTDQSECEATHMTPVYDELDAVMKQFHSSGVGGVKHFAEERSAASSVLIHTVTAVMWERLAALNAASATSARSVASERGDDHAHGRNFSSSTTTTTTFAPTPFKICEMGFGGGHSAALFLSTLECFLKLNAHSDAPSDLVTDAVSSNPPANTVTTGQASTRSRLRTPGSDAGIDVSSAHDPGRRKTSHEFPLELAVSMASFDLCRWGFEVEALKVINQHLFTPNQPLSLISGDTTATIPSYLNLLDEQVRRKSVGQPQHSAYMSAPSAGPELFSAWDAAENTGKRCDFMMYDVHELGYRGLDLFRSLARRPPPGVSSSSPMYTGAADEMQAHHVWRPSILFMDWCETDRTTELAWQRAVSNFFPAGGWLREIGCGVDRSNSDNACALKYCFARVYLD